MFQLNPCQSWHLSVLYLQIGVGAKDLHNSTPAWALIYIVETLVQIVQDDQAHINVAHDASAWISHPLEFQQWAISTPQDGLGIGKMVIKRQLERGSWCDIQGKIGFTSVILTYVGECVINLINILQNNKQCCYTYYQHTTLDHSWIGPHS
jgi:hypothetical protein